MASPEIKTLFLDLGGVMLTNGWDRAARQRVFDHFKLNFDEIENRHNLANSAFEEGKISFDNYLDWVIFNEQRSFSRDDIKSLMLEQSQAYPDMLNLIRGLKDRYRLRVYSVNNEGPELNDYRIQNFRLNEIFDAFLSSCIVHLRKPDPEIFRLALNVSQTRPENVIYIDDRPLFVDVAQTLGIHGIKHQNYQTTKNILGTWGLNLPT
jgi:putative hydrolase of the HAD superfamily